MKKLIKQIQLNIFNRRLSKAIIKADKKAFQTHQRYLVVLMCKKPIVKSKTELSNMINNGTLKNVDIQKIEQIALYKTY